MGKKIAFIGSSGGNLYKQGGNNLPAMMKEICGQTTAADMEITFVQYVLASGSLDNVGPDSPATLYTWNGTEVQAVFQGTLTEVNVEAEKVDAKLAKKIDDGEIDGVMFVSASPDGANRQAMEACARTKIPMAGTGGSGVALTQNMGCAFAITMVANVLERKKSGKNSSEKSLKKLKKLVDNQGDLRYNRFCCEGHKRNGTQ